MNEDLKLKTIGQLAELLSSTTYKRLEYNDGMSTSGPIPIYDNAVFTPEEHELVKKRFLYLISTL